MNAIGDPPTAPPVMIFAIPNIRRFLAFRLLFGVRFYYPVFAVFLLNRLLSGLAEALAYDSEKPEAIAAQESRLLD